MSSPTILFVLDGIQHQGKPALGDYGEPLGFGPGLTFESALVRWLDSPVEIPVYQLQLLGAALALVEK